MKKFIIAGAMAAAVVSSQATLAQAGRAMQLLAKTLEEQPEALIRGKREENP